MLHADLNNSWRPLELIQKWSKNKSVKLPKVCRVTAFGNDECNVLSYFINHLILVVAKHYQNFLNLENHRTVDPRLSELCLSEHRFSVTVYIRKKFI